MIIYLESIRKEVIFLAARAREYFELFAEDDARRLGAEKAVLYNSEMTRITLRLAAIITWESIQQSIAHNEMELWQASLGAAHIGLVENTDSYKYLPSYVRWLLDQTYELYHRVWRLHQNSEREVIKNLKWKARIHFYYDDQTAIMGDVI